MIYQFTVKGMKGTPPGWFRTEWQPELCWSPCLKLQRWQALAMLDKLHETLPQHSIQLFSMRTEESTLGKLVKEVTGYAVRVTAEGGE